MNKVQVKVCHVIENYKQKDGQQVYQVKLQVQVTDDPIGDSNGRYYYMKVLNPKVKVNDVVKINLDDYTSWVDEWTPEGEDKPIRLTYLKRVK